MIGSIILFISFYQVFIRIYEVSGPFFTELLILGLAVKVSRHAGSTLNEYNKYSGFTLLLRGKVKIHPRLFRRHDIIDDSHGLPNSVL